MRKKIYTQFILLSIIALVGVFYHPAASLAAGNCSWNCFDPSQYKTANDFCTSKHQQQTLGCSGSSLCHAQSETEACCCDPGTPAFTDVNSKTPSILKFPAPTLQISIPGLTFDDVNCPVNKDGSYTCRLPWMSQYIVAIYNYGLAIAGILAAIILIFGGLLWLISAGDNSRISQAKELITGSIVGLAILFSSYIILLKINPALVKFNPLEINTVKKIELKIAEAKNNGTAKQYKNMPCASDAELATGVEFYATGYYKPAWENSDTFRCVIAMQCSCPNGQDKSKNCDQLYGNTYPGYHPCNEFPKSTDYCKKDGLILTEGDIAGPDNCANLPKGTEVCFNGTTYKIVDSGGGIKGRRIDIWTGTSLEKAYKVTSTGRLTKGPCQK